MYNQLQSFLDKHYLKSSLREPYSIGGEVHIRFELGDDIENGTKERIDQVLKRAKRIFNETFKNTKTELWLLIYEYEDEFYDIEGNNKSYLYSLINERKKDTLYKENISISNGVEMYDENDKVIESENIKANIIIGKVSQEEIEVEKIIEGIANLEQGFEPKITQQVFLFDPITKNGFYMYDDRGCLIWSDQADKIRSIYIELNSWIVDYHRLEIDSYFK